MHQPGRNVALGSAVDSLTTALVGRWSDLVSEPRCAREREHGFERLVGQNLWRLAVLRQTGRRVCFVQKAETVPCGEELPHRSRL